MKTSSFLKTAALCAGGAFLAAGALMGDVVETKNGSRVTGKISQISATAVVVSTDYAGDVKIGQGAIVSIVSDEPLNVRLADGRVASGAIASTGGGSLTIASTEGAVTADFSQVKESWAMGAKDPEIARRERKWSYEAGMDVTGKTGNSEQIGTSFTFRALCESSTDKLLLYTGYDRQVTDEQKSADMFRAGADYQHSFSERFSWYARDEAGFDRVRDVDFYNTAAAGLGCDVVKNKIDTLTFRVGLSHRHEKYHDLPGGVSVPRMSEAGLDLSLLNRLVMKTWSMTNRLDYTPAFSDFGIYRIFHESYIELPMASPRWKFRAGVSNEYNSRPVPGIKRLDTTYFARLILTWK